MEAINYVITTHAKKRIKERLGIKPSAARRQFQLAVERNRMDTLPKSVLQWLAYALKERQAFPGHKDVAVYNKRAFVYGVQGDDRVLITILETPKEFEKYM